MSPPKKVSEIDGATEEHELKSSVFPTPISRRKQTNKSSSSSSSAHQKSNNKAGIDKERRRRSNESGDGGSSTQKTLSATSTDNKRHTSSSKMASSNKDKDNNNIGCSKQRGRNNNSTSNYNMDTSGRSCNNNDKRKKSAVNDNNDGNNVRRRNSSEKKDDAFSPGTLTSPWASRRGSADKSSSSSMEDARWNKFAQNTSYAHTLKRGSSERIFSKSTFNDNSQSQRTRRQGRRPSIDDSNIIYEHEKLRRGKSNEGMQNLAKCDMDISVKKHASFSSEIDDDSKPSNQQRKRRENRKSSLDSNHSSDLRNSLGRRSLDSQVHLTGPNH